MFISKKRDPTEISSLYSCIYYFVVTNILQQKGRHLHFKSILCLKLVCWICVIYLCISVQHNFILFIYFWVRNIYIKKRDKFFPNNLFIDLNINLLLFDGNVYWKKKKKFWFVFMKVKKINKTRILDFILSIPSLFLLRKFKEIY